jgi:Transposase Tn5 dimerisation domain
MQRRLKRTEGLGFINQTAQQGIKVHSCIAVSGSGEPLGLLHQYTWNRGERSGKKGTRSLKPTSEKESQRWLDGLKAAEAGVPDGVTVVHMGDREADIFDLFTMPRQAGSQLLIRAEHNRCVQHELGYLIPTIEQAPVLGECIITLQRNPKRPERTAQLQVRGMEVTIEVPKNHKIPGAEPVCLNFLLVKEINHPGEDEPIYWLLLTTLPITTFDLAWQCVRWYSLRWMIERFHFTLKSGCKIESLQLERAERLCKALVTDSIVAWRLMSLTYQSRLFPDASCQAVLQPVEWKLLRRKFEPKNRSKKPPTLRQALRWIAQLGGFLARKGDGEPGLKTLWRGIGTLHHMLEGAQLMAKT